MANSSVVKNGGKKEIKGIFNTVCRAQLTGQGCKQIAQVYNSITAIYNLF